MPRPGVTFDRPTGTIDEIGCVLTKGDLPTASVDGTIVTNLAILRRNASRFHGKVEKRNTPRINVPDLMGPTSANAHKLPKST
jgi:hypothetical protein